MRQEQENLVALTRRYRFTVRRGRADAVLAGFAFWLGWFSATAAHEVEKFAA